MANIKEAMLIVIDMQNDFIDGTLANPSAAAIIEPMAKFIKSHKRMFEHHKIYLTRDTHRDNYLSTKEGTHLPITHCISGTPGWCVNETIRKAAVDTCNTAYIDKNTFGYDGWNTSLFGRNVAPENIVLVGTCTDICVVSNAILLKTTFPSSNIYVIEDLCAGTTPENHKAAIDVMRACQIEIIKSTDL